MNLKMADVTEKAINYMTKVGYSYSRIDKIEKNESDTVWVVTVIVGIRKASELLWGAATQQINQLAAKHGRIIETHQGYSDFLREMTTERIFELFIIIIDLHENFYHEKIDDRDFPLYYKSLIDFLQEIETLLEK